jgi:hypothetical protein
LSDSSRSNNVTELFSVHVDIPDREYYVEFVALSIQNFPIGNKNSALQLIGAKTYRTVILKTTRGGSGGEMDAVRAQNAETPGWFACARQSWPMTMSGRSIRLQRLNAYAGRL